MAERTSCKGKSKGKCNGKDSGKRSKRTPEEYGFQLLHSGIFVRESQLSTAMPMQSCEPFLSSVEIGNLEKLHLAELPPGKASLEILCNRQTVFGNPFSMLCLKHKKPSTLDDQEKEVHRQIVCDLFDRFLGIVLLPDTSGSLAEAAEATMQMCGFAEAIVGKEWLRDFGPIACGDFRSMYRALTELAVARPNGIRLLCHCVPLRCHCMSLAARLCTGGSARPESGIHMSATGVEVSVSQAESSGSVCFVHPDELA
eukprot:TRINITY_DN5511_c0_g1_i1.p1 TRINITY_DN5511_c0_g1~~TRINITY_DN5511_c0_g1_i1.p1  ORF type:complete len:256 (+),score=18.22 TRINITY_DN5511_c0_g1_i1:87-854(+)